MINKFNILPTVTYINWCLLGIKRGIDDNNFCKYDNNKSELVKTYRMYSYKILYGFMGLYLYANPFLVMITIPKEIYRLEVNIKGIENEKKTDYYNKLF